MCKIPLPVQFNCWKHHAGYIREEINGADISSFNDLFSEIKVIGEGLMDLYFGNLQPAVISKLILSQLGTSTNRSEYIQWISENSKDFRVLEIPDGSQWVLRSGESEERYIHIHPARYSPLTIRVKAPTIKTAIAVSVYSRLFNEKADLSLINMIRKKYLNLSPVKSIQAVPALHKLISFFND